MMCPVCGEKLKEQKVSYTEEYQGQEVVMREEVVDCFCENYCDVEF